MSATAALMLANGHIRDLMADADRERPATELHRYAMTQDAPDRAAKGRIARRHRLARIVRAFAGAAG